MKLKIILSLIFFCLINAEANQYFQLFNHQDLIPSAKSQVPSKDYFNDVVCENHLNLFTNGLANNEEWAVKLMDTWAKIDSGYLSGNRMNFGNFDHCVRFRHQTLISGEIQGQHCWVTFSALPNSTLESDNTDINLRRFANFLRNNQIITINGFCLPASCSAEKVVEYLNSQILNRNDLIAYGADCKTNDSAPFEWIDYFAISLFTLITLIVIASTAYEIIKKQNNSESNKLYAAFSVYTNGSKLYDVTNIKSASSINCLHGLRAMSIFWIIFGHRMFNQSSWGNPNDVLDFQNDSLSTVVKAYHIAVDTFFVMGALLMTWSTLRDCEKKTLSIGRMIWRRYLRYTPVYAALILFTVSIGNHFYNGPFKVPRLLLEPCLKNWWMALLHIQNYLPMEDMCLNHGWYLSVDFQLFIISPFIIYLIYKYGRKLLAVPIVLCVASISYLIAISFALNIRAPALEISQDYLRWTYFPTYARAGPWLMGMVLGYFLYQNRGKTFKINFWLNAFMWILSFSVLLTVMFLQHAFIHTNEDTPIAFDAFYIAFQRNLWAIALCWIIFACQHLKTGGIVRWFLSLPQWQPISRMGLSMYMLHPIYQIIMMLNQRVVMYLNVWDLFPIYFSDIMAAILLATISYLAFEAPVLIIEDYVYKKLSNAFKKNKV